MAQKKAEFKVHPIRFFEGANQVKALEALESYKNRTGYHFDRLARESQRVQPNGITEKDIIAVSMLSVDIPAGGVSQVARPGT